ncbi:hypothetical protein Dd586_1935 [Dickeya parazeae Ech586]|uniref:Uncharacterized protein n=1 Tax=Dickeya zeae (strain Ech586) TaxID=590409 RepID=D2BZ97_DICZ5|nr:hypothetical protein Dd586_1935 [Dickeya parazeae Ech586]
MQIIGQRQQNSKMPTRRKTLFSTFSEILCF